jgi:predicted DNA-binding transcriptional regulator YafY
VPVYASQGKNGGLVLIEDYTVSRAALTDSERDGILAALQTVYKKPRALSQRHGRLHFDMSNYAL